MILKKFLTIAVAAVWATAAQAADEKSVHDFTVQSIDYTDLPMSSYEGKAVLMVNTASYCGYTPQYEGLQALWGEYKDKGLVVLGVPANDFGDQEPGNEGNIKNFCKVNFQVDFPMTKKMVVKGGEKNAPVYDYLAQELGEESRPKWNFHKYLIGPDGKPVAYFPSDVTPESPELRAAIDKALQ
ncbi:glutathione peroxidase [Kordiimonas aquimaris]|uniref:glutathione peroxidase n=1 Tax=Kordiimonas aquimaris TaxID=707591 RepID=UPI0021CF98A5|nr:glutathione peroxidase [Kordiimonas aquimaris]